MTDLQLEICKKIYPDSMIYSVCRDGLETVVPISLPRVLSVLKNDFRLKYNPFSEEIYIDDRENWFLFIPRKLLNPDWTDCYLWEQSEETQNKVAELLWVTF